MTTSGCSQLSVDMVSFVFFNCNTHLSFPHSLSVFYLLYEDVISQIFTITCIAFSIT